MYHKTPPGFRRNKIEGRVVFRPLLDARIAHAKLKRLVPSISYFDQGRTVASHLRIKHRYFFSTDLKSAFDFVTLERLKVALDWKRIEHTFLFREKQFFFHEEGAGGLIQGAPMSPYLFEFYCRFGGLDRDLMEYCDKLGFYYTRYADDILISSTRWLGKRAGPAVRKIVARHGFVLNDGKTKRTDINKTPLEVLGVVIRGKRLETPAKIMQKLHDCNRSEHSHSGLYGRSQHIRRLSLQKYKKRRT